MKRITVIFTAVILLLCLVPSAGMALLGPSAARANEIAPAEPELFSRDGEFNAELLSDTAEYLDESFYLRQELITLWARVKALFGQSTESGVVLGSDGWLYYVNRGKQNYIYKMRLDGSRGEEAEEAAQLSAGALFMQGVATSIDALSVGFTISEYGWLMALTAAIIIAVVTFFICMAGLRIGKKFGTQLSGKANILGGVILIGIGLEIFITGVF